MAINYYKKHFSRTPSIAPTENYQVANKKYVDDNSGGGGGSNREYEIYFPEHTFGSGVVIGEGDASQIQNGDTLMINDKSCVFNVESVGEGWTFQNTNHPYTLDNPSAITLDNEGKYHCAWIYNEGLYYMKEGQSPEIVGSAKYNQSFIDIKILSDGSPCIAYSNGNYNPTLSWKQNGSWVGASYTDDDDINRCLVAEYQGYKYMFWTHVGYLKCGKWTGSEWVVETLYDVCQNGMSCIVGNYNGSDYLYLFTIDHSAWGNGLHFFRYDGTSWFRYDFNVILSQYRDQVSIIKVSSELYTVHPAYDGFWMHASIDNGNSWINVLRKSTGDITVRGITSCYYNEFRRGVFYDTNFRIYYWYWNRNDWVWDMIYDNGSGSSVYQQLGLCADSSKMILSYPNITLWLGFYGSLDVKFTNIDTDNFGMGWSAVALKSSGIHCIAYIKDNSLCYAEWNGSSYDIEVVDSEVPNTLSTQLGFKLGYMDVPQIAYYKDDKIKFVWKIGGTWYFFDVASVSSPEVYISMTVYGFALYPAIAFIDSNVLKYAEWYGSGWTVSVVDDSPQIKKFTDIDYFDGKYHILYYKEMDNIFYSLMYAYYDLGWVISGIDTTNAYHKPSIYVKDSNIHISYIGINYSLKYGYKSGDNWSLFTLRNSDTVSCCISLNKNNYPVVGSIYYDGSNYVRGALEFNGSDWVSRVFEVNSNPGIGIDIVVNMSNDTRYFVYFIYEDNLYILKCAKWTTASQQLTWDDVYEQILASEIGQCGEFDISRPGIAGELSIRVKDNFTDCLVIQNVRNLFTDEHSEYKGKKRGFYFILPEGWDKEKGCWLLARSYDLRNSMWRIGKPVDFTYSEVEGRISFSDATTAFDTGSLYYKKTWLLVKQI